MAWKSGYQLRVRDLSGERVFAIESKSITVGRNTPGKVPSDKLLLLEDPLVSRLHLTLKWQLLKRAFMLTHKSETNSTLVNGEPCQRILLTPGDIITLGKVRIRLEKLGQRSNESATEKNLTTKIDSPTKKEDTSEESPKRPSPPGRPPSQPKPKAPRFTWKPPEER